MSTEFCSYRTFGFAFVDSRPSFGITVNKAKGQSFGGKLGLDLSEGCFSHEQLYIGLSWVTGPRNMTMCTNGEDTKTRNVVFREVLF